MVSYEKWRKALVHLTLQYENYRALGDDLPILIQEGIAEYVIHRFETCWDVLWKTLKQHLKYVLGLPDVPNSPKPILRKASENGLIEAVCWIRYADARINYSVQKAIEALEVIGDFIDDAIALYEQLSGNVFERSI